MRERAPKVVVQDYQPPVPGLQELERAVNMMERKLRERVQDNAKELTEAQFQKRWAQAQANRNR